MPKIIIANLDQSAKKRLLAAWNDEVPAKEIAARFKMSVETLRTTLAGMRAEGHFVRDRHPQQRPHEVRA